MSLNILVLHNIEDLGRARKSALDHVFAFQKYAPDNNYTIRPVSWPVNQALVQFPWDAVIFTSSALGIVTYRPRELFERQLEQWAFLADSPALKIVFPQDDADHGRLLDRLFITIKADYVFTVRPEFADFIYPQTVEIAEFESTFAGYLNDEDVDRVAMFAKEHGSREITLGQRVTLYSAVGGRLARLKGEAALAMKAVAIERGLPEDISVDPANIFLGDEWYKFLGNCKFVVGAEGGLGVWDPEGRIQDLVREFTNARPDASFEEIEAACFPGIDGNPEFPGFSPRILEAALLGCCQILVEGEYRGVLRPLEHYIPLKRDFSNFREVLVQMNDQELVNRLVKNCYKDLVQSDRFRYRTLVRRVMDIVERAAPFRKHQQFNLLPFASRVPIEELVRQAFEEGYRWPSIANRVFEKVRTQILTTPLNDLCEQEIEQSVRYAAFNSLWNLVESQTSSPPKTTHALSLAILDIEPARALTIDRLISDSRFNDWVRLIEAATKVPELLGLSSRLAPGNGLQFTEAELQNLLKLDELLVRTSGTGVGAILRQLDLGERGERAQLALEAGGDISRLILALADPAQASALAGIVSRIAPRSGDRFTSEEVAALQELDRFLVLAGANPFETFRPPEAGRADKVRASAEVLDWPSEGLALLVIEVLSRAGSNRDAADKIIGILRQSVSPGPKTSTLSSLIPGWKNKRND